MAGDGDAEIQTISGFAVQRQEKSAVERDESKGIRLSDGVNIYIRT